MIDKIVMAVLFVIGVELLIADEVFWGFLLALPLAGYSFHTVLLIYKGDGYDN